MIGVFFRRLGGAVILRNQCYDCFFPTIREVFGCKSQLNRGDHFTLNNVPKAATEGGSQSVDVLFKGLYQTAAH